MNNCQQACRRAVFSGVAWTGMVAVLSALVVSSANAQLHVETDESAGQISVFREGRPEPVLTQNARPDFRPYIHPLVAPDGQGELTQYSPGHHPHQTGLYWGFTRVNGRDYFHHPAGDYWRRVSFAVTQADEAAGEGVQWRTVYDLLDEAGQAVLTETQTWTMRVQDGEYVLDVDWIGEARVDVTIGKYDYGGLFLRMPWREGVVGEVVNAARQRNERAEGNRAPWLDVGMQVPGRNDLAHIAIFDHSQNPNFPQAWRVDGQLGVGPVPSRSEDWKIAAGEKAQLRYQLRIYTGELDDVKLTEQWSDFSGEGGTWALWNIAQQEGRAAEFLTPEKAVANMTLPPGFQVNVFAAEPMMTQPMAFCWDDRGRLWIAENRDYESRGGGFANSGDSRIVILADTDGDGTADSRQVFLEGIPFPSAIAVGFDGLWLGAPPNLLFVPDRDRDDSADEEHIEIRLTGWGIRDRHETLNSLHWGPDGWLYGCQGFATPSQVGKPAGDGRLQRHGDPFPREFKFSGQPVDINGGVWRYHPTKDRFEVVAHGFSNPWGIDYDAKGQLFISACVIPHLWHVVPGGVYHRQGGQHFNPYIYSDIRTIADHRHRSAHGGARVYLSDAFPDEYQGRIFMANIHEHAVLTDVLEPRGSGFVGRHGDDFLLANNAQWIGFSLEIGPEGGVYVLDWHDADICGKEVLNKDTGRVFRITPTNSLARSWPDRGADVSSLSDARLVELQLSPSAWHARRARVVLQHRAATGSLSTSARAQLRDIFRGQTNPDHRLRAMWGLHVTGSFADSDLMETLGDDDPYVRAWAIQLLCEDLTAPPAALEKFIELARDDSSPVVRLYLAAALQRMEHESRWEIAAELARHGEDVDDHNIPKMIWFGVEPLVLERPDRALELAGRAEIPLLTRFIARRLADGDKLDALTAAIGNETPRDVQRQLLLGLRDALEGRFDVAAPSGWDVVFARLREAGGENALLGLELAQQFGDTAAARRMLNTLQEGNAEVDERRRALQGLAGRQFPALEPLLVDLLDDAMLRRDAIRAMAAFDEDDLADALLGRYASFSTDEKLDVIHTLAARSSYGRKLTRAIRRGEIPKRDVPAYVARQLRRVVGNSFVDVWGPIDSLSTDKEAAFAKYEALLTDQTISDADPSQGRDVFRRTCYACHKMYGDGGEIGPEITGANRTNLEYVLGNVLTPSAVIQDAYRMVIVVTDEGRIYSGIPAGENDRQLQLRVANESRPVVIAKSQIESREIAPVSMMPEGLLDNLSDREVLDLMAYLRTPAQVPLPANAER